MPKGRNLPAQNFKHTRNNSNVDNHSFPLFKTIVGFFQGTKEDCSAVAAVDEEDNMSN